MTVLLFYQELTHDGPTGFYEAPDDMVVRLINDWMKAWPYGKVVAMTQPTFRQTVWYRSFVEKGWGVMTYTPESNNVSNSPASV